MSEIYYRYVAELDSCGVTVVRQEWAVVGRTPKCVYIVPEAQRGHWEYIFKRGDKDAVARLKKRVAKRVLIDPNGRRFAYKCKWDALKSFRRRQISAIHHNKLGLSRAELALFKVDDLLKSAANNLGAYAPTEIHCGHNEYTRSLNYHDY